MSHNPQEPGAEDQQRSHRFGAEAPSDDGESQEAGFDVDASGQSQSDDRFGRVAGRAWGYDPQTVDAFFADAESTLEGRVSADEAVTSSGVRGIAFGRARGGYEPAEVDASLDEVENNLAELENELFIQEHGRTAWEAKLGELSELIFGRLERPDGKRFRSPSGASTRGYAVVDVDALCHALVEELSRPESLDPDRVRTAVFGPAVGEDSYEEQQVDAFLDKVVELLLALR